MKYNGLLVDQDLMATKKAEAEAALVRIREEIGFITGDVNIGANASTAAFKRYLYEDLKLPVFKVTAKYQEAMDDEALVLLSEWREANRPDLTPLFKLVQDYRRTGKIKSTYIDGCAQHIYTAAALRDFLIDATAVAFDFETAPDEIYRAAMCESVCEREFTRCSLRREDKAALDAHKSHIVGISFSVAATRAGLAGADDIGVRNFFVAPEGMALLSPSELLRELCSRSFTRGCAMLFADRTARRRVLLPR
jgi:hypothetical protein